MIIPGGSTIAISVSSVALTDDDDDDDAAADVDDDGDGDDAKKYGDARDVHDYSWAYGPVADPLLKVYYSVAGHQ